MRLAAEEIKLIQQPNTWTCLAACAAMITDTTIEEFITFAGHDGSDYDPDSDHPEKKRGFRMGELAAYLALHGYHVGCHLTADFKVDEAFGPENLAVWTVESEKLPPPNTHLVIWIDGVVFDPIHPEPQKRDKYVVTEWWPIIEWDSDLKPLWNQERRR